MGQGRSNQQLKHHRQKAKRMYLQQKAMIKKEQERSNQRLKYLRRKATRVFLTPLAKKRYLQQKAMTKKEQAIWECVTSLALVLVAAVMALAILAFLKSGYTLEVGASFTEVLLGFLLYACLKKCNKEEYKKVVARAIIVVMVAPIVVLALIEMVAPIVSNWIPIIPVSGIDVDPFIFLLILVTLLFAGFASYGLLICWKIKDAKDARERTMGLATVASSVAGILLTVALAFMSTVDS